MAKPGAHAGRRAALLALWVIQPAAGGCTEILVRSSQGDFVVANTVEAPDFYHLAGKRLRPSRRGEWRGGGPIAPHGGGTDGRGTCLSFQLKYGFVGGMNEEGLTVHHHALNLALFQEPLAGSPSLCKRHFEEWALGSFATVGEVAESLRGVRVVGGLPLWGGTEGGQWGLQDSTGAAIVVEFVRGQLRVHNNSEVGILTNDPTWDWHVANLNNFAALQPGWYAGNNVGASVLVGDDPWYPYAADAYRPGLPAEVPSPISLGANLLGLPGDASPAARFVRAFFLRQYAMLAAAPSDLNETLILGQELLNAVYKVRGTVPSAMPGRLPADHLETTPVATLKVPRTKEVYTRSRADLTWRRIDLKRLDFSPDAQARLVEVASDQFFAIDVTDDFLAPEAGDAAETSRALEV